MKTISDADFTPSLKLTKSVTEPLVQSFLARVRLALLMYRVLFCVTLLGAVVIFSSFFLIIWWLFTLCGFMNSIGGGDMGYVFMRGNENR